MKIESIKDAVKELKENEYCSIPLHLASYGGHTEAVKVLRELGGIE